MQTSNRGYFLPLFRTSDRSMISFRREAMNQNRCRHCHTIFFPNPRIKNQQYCNRSECQRARKALWQKQKMQRDPDYQENHLEAQKNWLKDNPGYWKAYRAGHPTYVEVNRLKQQNRDRKRRLVHLAKIDTSA
jgi:hypothetical protein